MSIKVRFYSPGTFVAENDMIVFDKRNLKDIYEYSKHITQRYGAIPYAFAIEDEKGQYFLNCKIENYDTIAARNDPTEETLLWNMRCKHWPKVAKTTVGYDWTQPFEVGDSLITEENGEMKVLPFYLA